jgi:hypothetical protein
MIFWAALPGRKRASTSPALHSISGGGNGAHCLGRLRSLAGGFFQFQPAGLVGGDEFLQFGKVHGVFAAAEAWDQTVGASPCSTGSQTDYYHNRLARESEPTAVTPRAQSLPLWSGQRLHAHHAHASPGPFEDLLRCEAVAEAWARIDKLPPRQQQAFVLRVIDGWSYADIGQALGIESATAKKHVFLATQSVRQGTKTTSL